MLSYCMGRRMKNKILDWLNSSREKIIDFNDEKNRLTINPQSDFVFIKYWEPSPIKETDLSIWKIISEIKITPIFIESSKDYMQLSEILFEKLKMGGNYEITTKNL
jgi:hypothetical protein